MKKSILLFITIIHSALSMQEEHPYRVHCADGTINLSEYEWHLLAQSSDVIQHALDLHSDDKNQDITRLKIKTSTLIDIVHFLIGEKHLTSSYNLHRIHKILLGASYLNIDPQKTVKSISYLKKLLIAADITDFNTREILRSKYALQNKKILNDPMPIIPLIKTLQDNTESTCAQEMWNQHIIRTFGSEYITSDFASIDICDPFSGKTIRTLRGHTNIIPVILKCDNNILASGSADTTIKLWDLNSGECINTLSGHTQAVNSLVMCDNNVLASGSDDGTIKLWNLNSGQCLHTLHNSSMNRVNKLAAGPNNILASGSDDSTISLWDLNSLQHHKTLEGHNGWISALAIGNNNILASGANDKVIKLWDIHSGKCITTLKGHTDSIDILFICNNILASGSKDKTIKLWNINSGQCFTTLDGFHGKISKHKKISQSILKLSDYINSRTMIIEHFKFTTLKIHKDTLIAGSSENTMNFWDISALHPEKYTPIQNALMRTVLKYKEQNKGSPKYFILHNAAVREIFFSLPQQIKEKILEILEPFS